ncbi:MAG TPA: DinB family protein [Rhizomicrobium sp.]|nr:DinB family protein [Rhizomicrobium sp.]
MGARAGSWTVRETGGTWRPDWSETEPDPVPPVTIGWLTRHVIRWWSGVLAAIARSSRSCANRFCGRVAQNARSKRLNALSEQWREILSRLEESDLEQPLAYPWAEPRPLRIAVAWVASELMKNIAEIGMVRHLFESQRHS